MSSNSDDVEILQDVMNTPGITIIGTEDHLGHYGSLIEDVPGIDAYFKEKYDWNEKSSCFSISVYSANL
mgnify:CR=1 FL=1